LSAAERQIAITRDDYDADIQRARTFLASRLYKEAISEAARAQALDGSRWESYAVVCLVMVRQQKDSEAAKYRDMALKRAPDDVKSQLDDVLSEQSVANRSQGSEKSPSDMKAKGSSSPIEISSRATPSTATAPDVSTRFQASTVPGGVVKSERPTAPFNFFGTNTPAPSADKPSGNPEPLRAATVHIYRQQGRWSSAAAEVMPLIMVDGKESGVMPKAGIVTLLLLSGKHSLAFFGDHIQSDQTISGLELQAGEEYWVRGDLDAGMVARKVHAKLQLVSAEEGKTESKGLMEKTVDLH